MRALASLVLAPALACSGGSPATSTDGARDDAPSSAPDAPAADAPSADAAALRSPFGAMGRSILDAAHVRPWGSWYRAGVALCSSLGPSVGLGDLAAGRPTLHLASGAFAPTDVGKVVLVPGAGLQGQAPLVGAIVSYQGAADVTLDVAAGATVAGAPVSFAAPSYRTSFPTFPGFPAQPDIAGMRAAGVRFVPTILHHTGGQDDPEVPVVDDSAYEAALNSFIDEWHPDALIFGNEVDLVFNWPYVAGGGHAAYAHMISLGARVAHARGLRCGAAAVMDFNLKHAVYRWLDETAGHDAAETFQRQMNGFAPDAARADVADRFLDDVKAAGCDAMVWHFYQDAKQGTVATDATEHLALPRYREYFDARFAGPSWNNEWGNRSYRVWGEAQAETDIRHLIGALRDLGLEMAIAYGSGAGPNVPDQLWDGRGDPTPEGQAAIDAIAALP